MPSMPIRFSRGGIHSMRDHCQCRITVSNRSARLIRYFMGSLTTSFGHDHRRNTDADRL